MIRQLPVIAGLFLGILKVETGMPDLSRSAFRDLLPGATRPKT
jgi:hypothetical protein